MSPWKNIASVIGLSLTAALAGCLAPETAASEAADSETADSKLTGERDATEAAALTDPKDEENTAETSQAWGRGGCWGGHGCGGNWGGGSWGHGGNWGRGGNCGGNWGRGGSWGGGNWGHGCGSQGRGW